MQGLRSGLSKTQPSSQAACARSGYLKSEGWLVACVGKLEGPDWTALLGPEAADSFSRCLPAVSRQANSMLLCLSQERAWPALPRTGR